MLTIVDYGMGNLNSVFKAFEVLRAEPVLSNRVEDLELADRIVLPGVGAFGEGMKNLRALGLVEPLREQVVRQRKPFLGLCLGMQLVARDSSEQGQHQGLGWIEASVRALDTTDDLKSIHIGWNDVSPDPDCPLFVGLGPEPNFYFVHRYHVACDDPSIVAGTTHYGHPFAAAIQSGNILGAQFHPEKSQETGLAMLRNFLKWEG